MLILAGRKSCVYEPKHSLDPKLYCFESTPHVIFISLIIGKEIGLQKSNIILVYHTVCFFPFLQYLFLLNAVYIQYIPNSLAVFNYVISLCSHGEK